MSEPAGCPEVTTLLALATGSLSPLFARPLRRHLNACTACQAAVAEAVRGKTPEAHRQPPASLLNLGPGTLIGSFCLDTLIGVGGVGTVWSATRADGERFALKILKISDRDVARRLRREARVTREVEHANVVRVYDVLTVGEPPVPALVMELLEGEDLGARFRRAAPLNLIEVLETFAQVAGALEAIHARGILHRDLKPANVFLARSEAGEQVKVLDLGMARSLDLEQVTCATERLTADGTVLGTARYMAPEQLLAMEVSDGRVDVWALGIMLHEALVGRHPLRSVRLPEILDELTSRHFAPADDTYEGAPPRLGQLVRQCLTRSVEGRPSAAAVRQSLLDLSR